LGNSRFVVAVCACVAYVAIGQRVGQQYPFSALPMWSTPVRQGGRVLARSPSGLAEISDFEAWDCERVDFVTPRAECVERAPQAELDRQAEDWVRSHAKSLPNGEPVSIVRRVYTVERTRGPLIASECELARCRAVRSVSGGR